MEALVDEGLAKNIGVSNTTGALLLDILRYARYAPQVAQIELHPYLTQEPFIELAKTLGIAVTAYSSFGPQGWVELGMSKGLTLLMEHDTIASVSKKHSKSEFETNGILQKALTDVVQSSRTGPPPLGNPAGSCCYSQEQQPQPPGRKHGLR